jgi:hypothetical protein
MECGGMIHPINRTHTPAVYIYIAEEGFHAIWPQRPLCSVCFVMRFHFRSAYALFRLNWSGDTCSSFLVMMMESTISHCVHLSIQNCWMGHASIAKIKVRRITPRHVLFFCRLHETVGSISKVHTFNWIRSRFACQRTVYISDNNSNAYSRSNNSVIDVDVEGILYTSCAHTPELVMELISLSSWIIFRPTRPRATPALALVYTRAQRY